MDPIIAGIQQVGIGIPDVNEAFAWYRKHFGMDIKVFDDEAEANLMLPYTGGMPHKRHAILALTIRGGGGFEIWQYKSREPVLPAFEIQLGDTGIFVARMKSSNVKETYNFIKSTNAEILGELSKAPDGTDHFFVRDPYGNIFEVVESDDWFGNAKSYTGGPGGCMIGVTDVGKALDFYATVLGYDTVLYDKEGVFEDLKCLPGGASKVRRILLAHSQPRAGSFSKLLGSSNLELISAQDRTPRKIYENRYWGDRGFIHLCFDINGMANMKALCEKNGYPFTVDSSGSFDMGEAAGYFSYVEDPDGTLIEFVETHRIPIFKKIGWFLDLRKRDPKKSLPDWMLKALSFNRVKD
jgi:catechol 2,3-dioxygenase-like lactoylglutathione lyase family enzyme